MADRRIELHFALSGSVIFTTDAVSVPEVGSRQVFRTQGYKKGIEAGTLVVAIVSGESENEYDYSQAGKVIVRIDVNPVSPVNDDLPD